MPPSNLYDLSLAELTSFVEALGEPRFRAKQIWQWLWQKGVPDFQAMTNISKSLRSRMQKTAQLQRPKVIKKETSQDQTRKLLLELTDGELIETVLIPEKDHFTQCLSTQVGCPLACTFCRTGQMSFVRNLSVGEILTQILLGREILAQDREARAIRNLVFMGMGDPLLNLKNLLQALTTIRDPQALGFSYRRTTVSTVGLRGPLHRLVNSDLASLAISLHAPTDELRYQLMPQAAKMCPLPDLMQTLESLPLRPRQRITIEYLLLGQINDGLAEARELNRLLAKLKCKINLIPFNPCPELPYQPPSQERILAFQKFLWDKGLTVTIRKSKGQDIQAACGQLKSKVLKT